MMKKFVEIIKINQAHLLSICGFLLLPACLLGKCLVSSEWILSDGPRSDIFNMFYHMQSLAHEGFAKGEIITWNPYIQGGTPFLGAFQYALLYPPNWVCSLLPLPLALNWLIYAHIVLMGTTMYCWATFRKISAPGAFLAGVVMMFCGPYFSRLTAGHIPHLCAMAWIPLVFLGIDGWIQQRKARWIVISAGAAALQIYAGFPQYFYYTAMFAGLYSLFSIYKIEEKKSAVLGLLAIYPLAVLLSAAQLLPGYAAAAESVRAGGVSYEFFSENALPWENISLIFAPWTLGGFKNIPYWGGSHIAEAMPYCGVGAFFLAIVCWLREIRINKAKYLVLVVFAVVLALGYNTPLNRLMFDYMPGYSSFRSVTRLTIFLALFVALLSGQAVGDYMGATKTTKRTGYLMLGAVAGLLLTGILLYTDCLNQAFENFIKWMAGHPTSYMAKNLVSNANYITAARVDSAVALLMGAMTLLLFSVILIFIKRNSLGKILLVALAAGDLVFFASRQITRYETAYMDYAPIAAFRQQHPGDFRDLNLVNPDSDILLRAEGLWGYDALVSKRYAEFIAFSQGIHPDQASMNVVVTKNSRLFSMLRARYAFVPTTAGIKAQMMHDDVLPRFFVTGKYEIVPDRNQILTSLLNSSFDFKKDIIVERSPGFPATDRPAAAEIQVVESKTNKWVVSVKTDAPTMLVMTDSYSRDWKAKAMRGSAETQYDLMPVNYAIRGIPLKTAGTHLLEIKYAPSGYRLGIILTVFTALSILAIGLTVLLRARNKGVRAKTCA